MYLFHNVDTVVHQLFLQKTVDVIQEYTQVFFSVSTREPQH